MQFGVSTFANHSCCFPQFKWIWQSSFHQRTRHLHYFTWFCISYSTKQRALHIVHKIYNNHSYSVWKAKKSKRYYQLPIHRLFPIHGIISGQTCFISDWFTYLNKTISKGFLYTTSNSVTSEKRSVPLWIHFFVW